MKELTLRQLRYFLAVVDAGSITRAAQELHIAPGGVAAAISDLERALGAQLLRRQRSKGVTLTSIGTDAVQVIRPAVDAVDDIATIGRAFSDQVSGTLRLGCFPTLSPTFIPPIVQDFLQAHPGIKLALVEEPSTVLQEGLRSGTLDAAITFLNHMQAELPYRILRRVRVQLVVGSAHRLAGRSSTFLREVADEPAVLQGQPDLVERVDTMLRRSGVRPHVVVRSNNWDTVHELVARGIGYSLIAVPPPARWGTSDQVSYLDLEDEAVPPNALVLALPPDGRMPNRVQALLAFCEEHFGDEQRAG